MSSPHKHVPPTRMQSYVTEERGHGRTDRRECQVYSVPRLGKILGWEDVNAIARIRKDTTYAKSGKETSEIRYFVSSLSLEPRKIAEAARAHWRIENNLHWQLDVSFGEDADRKKKKAAQNFSLIRKVALTVLKADDTKASLVRKRKMAGWDDGFLEKLMKEVATAFDKENI